MCTDWHGEWLFGVLFIGGIYVYDQRSVALYTIFQAYQGWSKELKGK